MKWKTMKKVTAPAVLTLSAMLFLAGCEGNPIAGLVSGGGMQYNGEKGGEPVNMSKVVDFRFGYSSGTYMNSGCTYEASLKGDAVEVKVRQDEVDMDDVPVITTDASFLEKIDEILAKNQVEKWNGFSLSAQDVMDGDSFSLFAAMDNGERIHASGYEAWPEGYANVRGELDSLFVDLYESFYPNKQKALKKYCETELQKDSEFIQEVEISFPYTSDGPGYFRYGNAAVPDCIVSRKIGNFTTEDTYTNDPRDLLIARLHQEPDGETDTMLTVLSIELYTIDDEMNITKLGEEVVDDMITWNDGIYGYLFTHDYGETLQIGYFAQHHAKASTDGERYMIRLYEVQEGELKQVADEELTAPKGEELTKDDYPEFVELAGKYNYFNSLNHWEEKAFDPVLVKTDFSVLVDLYTKTNFDSGFIQALEETPKGEKVGNYEVAGTFTGVTWSD